MKPTRALLWDCLVLVAFAALVVLIVRAVP